MKPSYKKGDKVIFIETGYTSMTHGKEYEITSIDDPNDGPLTLLNVVTDNGNVIGFYAKRFKPSTVVPTIDELVKKAKSLVGKSCIDSTDGDKFNPTTIKIAVDETQAGKLSIRSQDSFRKNGFVVALVQGGLSLPVEELILAPDSKTIELTKDYDAEVFKDKVVVGCQTIPIAKLEELLKLSKTL